MGIALSTPTVGSTVEVGEISDPELIALGNLTSAADKLPYFTGSGTAALAAFTSAGRDLVDDADASAQRTTLGLGTLATKNTAADTDLDSPNNAVPRVLLRGGSTIGTAQTQNTFLPVSAGNLASGAGLTLAQAGSLEALYFDDANFPVAGKTVKMILRAQLFTNATAPGTITFTVGLHNITGVAGGSNALAVTVNTTAVTSSTVAFVNPSASTTATGITGVFDVPADGHYAICCTSNATSATNGLAWWQGRLFTEHA